MGENGISGNPQIGISGIAITRWDKGEYSKLCKLLDINWDDISDVSNAAVDEMCENFKEIVIGGMNLFIPRGNQRLKRSNKNHQPFNNELNDL